MRTLKLASLALGVASITLLCLDPAPMAVASNWSASIEPGSTAESDSGSAPATPSAVTATCTSPFSSMVTVNWIAVSSASAYDVYESTISSSGGYVLAQDSVVGTSWTTGSLSTGDYWFEVSASLGTKWASSHSAATAQRSVTFDLVCT
jgi:hypothetical protein